MRPPANALPALALTLNALVWGCSWLPFRLLNQQGLHPLWATVLIYALSVLVIALLRPQAVRHLLRTPALWLLLLAAGTTNAAFNWAAATGDVVRVVLLFYLMPLWSVLLARWLLHEPLTLAAGVRVALALAGAAVVLWPEGQRGWPLPRSLSDWLAVLGGFSFALNNVLLRRGADEPAAARALAMFVGGVTVAGAVATGLAVQGSVAWPPAPSWAWLPLALAMGLAFLLSNLSLQYGATRLPAHVSSVVMLSEVLFASASAVALGAGALSPALWLGGGLIVLAALLATLQSPQ